VFLSIFELFLFASFLAPLADIYSIQIPCQVLERYDFVRLLELQVAETLNAVPLLHSNVLYSSSFLGLSKIDLDLWRILRSKP
jgi:hypothetical protein